LHSSKRTLTDLNIGTL